MLFSKLVVHLQAIVHPVTLIFGLIDRSWYIISMGFVWPCVRRKSGYLKGGAIFVRIGTNGRKLLGINTGVKILAQIMNLFPDDFF